MSAEENLSPHQFMQQHADYHSWTKQEERNVVKAHEVSPGHSSFRGNPEAGKRISRLRDSRQWLEDHYSPNVHHLGYGKTQDEYAQHLGVPLHEALDEQFHGLADDYLKARGKS